MSKTRSNTAAICRPSRVGLSLLASAALLAPAASAAVPPSMAYAQYFVTRSRDVLGGAGSDRQLDALLQRCRGVLIIPNYGQAPAGVSGRGGEGVVVARLGGRWSDPAFYQVGGVGIAPPPYGAGGSVVMLLMSRKALDDVMNGAALDPRDGLSIAGLPTATQKADVVVWSDIWGAYLEAASGAAEVRPDVGQDQRYYGRAVTVRAILSGTAVNPAADQLTATLKNATAA